MATIRCREHVFKRVEAVLFDKDGTLADVEHYLKMLGAHRLQFIEDRRPGLRANLLQAFGLAEDGIDPAGLMAVGSRAENEVAAAAYVAATGMGWIEAIALVRSAFDAAKVSLSPQVIHTPLLAGAAQLLKQLKTTDIQIGIVSSDSHQAVADFIDHYHLNEIDWYCGASPETLPKTHPGFLKFAGNAMGINPAATLVVGDSAADLALADQGAAGFIGMIGGWQRGVTLRRSPLKTANLPIVTIEQLTLLESFK
ncbi:MAG: HAD family hydrolase [Phormidesmis sp.]